MSEQFKVGEVCELMYSRYHSTPSGTEVTIIRAAQWALNEYTGTNEWKYGVELPDGKRRWCLPDQLRRKRPPRDDLEVVRWAECPWQPNRITQTEGNPSHA